MITDPTDIASHAGATPVPRPEQTDTSGAYFSGVLASRAIQLMVAARQWCSSYGFHRGATIEASALTIAFAMPVDIDIDALVPGQLLGVWLSVVDDVLDTTVDDADRIQELVRRYTDVAAGGRCAIEDPYAHALADIVARLDALPDVSRWRSSWEHEVATVMADWEWAWRVDHAQHRPGLDEYLSRSSAYACWPVVIALWMAVGGPPEPAPLRESFDHAQTALMLTNDLATATREHAQRTLSNALLLGADRAAVRQLIDHHLTEHKRLAGPVGDSSAAQVVTRLTDFLLGIQQIDIHHPEWRDR